MKIALMGTHGVGKTSVAEMFSERYGVPIVTSASRRVKKLGYPINQHATCESQAATSMGRLAAQVAAGDNFISDRTLLDSMAYNKWQLEHVWSDDVKAEYWYDTMDIIAEHMMHQYDYLFYVPITFPLVADGVRAMEAKYQAEIDVLVQEFIERYGLEYAPLPPGTVEERVVFVREFTQSIAF
jgi:predicted ATPase